MKQRKKSWICMMFLLMGMGLLEGCGSSSESNVTVGNRVHSTQTEEQKEEKKKEQKEDSKEEQNTVQQQEEVLYIIQQIDFEKQEVRLQNVETGRITEYGISDATAFRDKYGEFAGNDSMVEGRIVKIGAENAQGKLSYLQIAEEAWEQEDIQRFRIEQDRNMIVIGETKYYYDDSLLVFLGGEQVSLDMITESDRLRVAGVDKQIASVCVSSGHGFLVLSNTELFEGGWLSVGNERVVEIEKELKLEIPEGTYQVSVAKEGYGDTKEVTIAQNETLVLNLEEYKGEGIKHCKATFQVKPETAEVTVDGKKVKVGEAVNLRYGSYQLKVSSPEYGEISRRLVVSSKEAQIEINLPELFGKEESEDTSSSLNSNTNSQTTGGSSTSSNSSNHSTNSNNSGKTNGSGASNSSGKTNSSETSNNSTDAKEDSEKETLQQLSDFISTLLD